VAAVLIDYAGPAWLTRERLRGLQRVAVAHFAERYSLFVIICLGESIVAIGAGARVAERPLTVSLVTALSLGVLVTVGMWWTYFDHFAAVAEERLREHRDAVLAAADAYSYLHLVIVAGIITFADGVKLLVRGSVDSRLPGAVRLALCGGVALYLLGHVGFRLRMAAWQLTAGIAVLVGLLCVAETAGERHAREPRGRVCAAHGRGKDPVSGRAGTS
jgi:low temperature requirement protein LtrA